MALFICVFLYSFTNWSFCFKRAPFAGTGHTISALLWFLQSLLWLVLQKKHCTVAMEIGPETHTSFKLHITLGVLHKSLWVYLILCFVIEVTQHLF